MKELNIAYSRESYKKIFVFVAVLWIASVLFLSSYAFLKITGNLQEEIGSKAMLVAMTIASDINLTQEEVLRLLELDYNSLIKDQANIEFEAKARELMGVSDIKYVYLEMLAPEIEYYVHKDEANLYKLPEGTPLNTVFLLDAVVDDNTRFEVIDGDAYVNKDRYNAADEILYELYEKQAPGYYRVSDRWGSFITGFAPVYDTENILIGMVGVDLYINKYLSLIDDFLLVIGGLIAANLLVAGVAARFLFKFKSVDRQLKEKTVLSGMDYLTSCMNRRLFNEVYEKEWEKSISEKRNLAVIFVDIDYFKEFNDNYGHVAGDDNLKKISESLIKIATRHGGIVGRYGGDEFILMLPDCGVEKTEVVAKRIIKAIQDLQIEHEMSPVSSYQTVSVGAASIVPVEHLNAEDLINYADDALYKSKRYGRNHIYIWNKSSADNLRDQQAIS